jgi:branched-chain amino acid transport system ATP-binding protein
VTSASTANSGTSATPTTEAALSVRDLDAGYDGTQVLRNVTLTVPAGGVTALLGPNGAGKTTLLRTVAGFLPASSGRVEMLGEDVTKVPAYRRFAAGLSLIPEGRGIFRSLTVRENLQLQARKGEEAEAIDRATAAFPVLRERISQAAGTMSGGQQQMLAMASAYVRNPRLVLVDEASLGLAPLIVDELFGFLASLPERGASLLIVDQFVTRALQMASSAYVMRRGEIAFSGGAQELLNGDLFSHYVGG